MKKVTMKHQLKTNAHKACSKDTLRAWMTYVTFWDGYAYATDAHVLIKQSLTDIGFKEEDLPMLHGRMILPGKMAALLKAGPVVVNEHGILDYDNNIQYNWDRQVVDLFGGKDPAFLRLMDDIKKDPISIDNRIGFNSHIIKEAMSLFPRPGVLRWEFYSRTKGVIISYDDSGISDTVVVVMPAMLHDQYLGADSK